MLNDVRPVYPGSTAAAPARAEEWADFPNHGDPNAPYRARAAAVSVARSGTVKWYAVAVGRDTGVFSS